MSFVFPDLLFAINISDYLTGMKYSAIVGKVKCTLKISSNTKSRKTSIYQKTMMLKFNIFARFDFKSIKCFFFHFTHKWDGVAKYVLTVNCRKSCQVFSFQLPFGTPSYHATIFMALTDKFWWNEISQIISKRIQ